MGRALVLSVIGGVLGGGCGPGPAGACDLPAEWTSPTSGNGDLCQVHIVSAPPHDVYCSGETGNWSCACGPLADNPRMFVSADLCDLALEDRVCEAIDRCSFAP